MSDQLCLVRSFAEPCHRPGLRADGGGEEAERRAAAAAAGRRHPPPRPHPSRRLLQPPVVNGQRRQITHTLAAGPGSSGPTADRAAPLGAPIATAACRIAEPPPRSLNHVDVLTRW